MSKKRDSPNSATILSDISLATLGIFLIIISVLLTHKRSLKVVTDAEESSIRSSLEKLQSEQSNLKLKISDSNTILSRLNLSLEVEKKINSQYKKNYKELNLLYRSTGVYTGEGKVKIERTSVLENLFSPRCSRGN